MAIPMMPPKTAARMVGTLEGEDETDGAADCEGDVVPDDDLN